MALNWRVAKAKQASYVDMAVWVPFGRRAMRAGKFRACLPVGNGEFIAKEIPGPENFTQWQASWRLFAVAMVMLGFADMAHLDAYCFAFE